MQLIQGGKKDPEGRILTQSEMATFANDPRHWYLSWYLRLRPVYDHAYIPDVGTLFHAGLQAYYEDRRDPLAVVQARATDVINEIVPDGPRSEQAVDEMLKAAEMAAIMLEGYLEWCPAEDAHLKITGAEEKVEMQLGDSGFVLRGKIDARAIDLLTDARVQLEHKTVANLTDLPRYAQSNFQFLTYDLLAYLQAQAEEDPDLRTDGVLLNMARRVKRTARANPPFYGRHPVRHNLHELRNHYRHVVSLGRRIRRIEAGLDAGASHQDLCPPRVSRDSTWSNPFFTMYALMDDGSDWEGMAADLFEVHDPLERYEEDDG